MKKRVFLSFISAALVGALLCGCTTMDVIKGSASDEEVKESFQPDLTSFSTTDLEGNTVTQDVFKDYDVTMINVWDTTCQNCIDEMPSLEKIYEDLDDNVNLIGICTDGADATKEAKKIVKDTGITYLNIEGNDAINPGLDLNGMTIHPITFYVDSEGNMIDAIVCAGAPGDDEDTVIEAYTSDLNKAIEAAGK